MVVIPGRAKREPGIHNHDREYGFRACAQVAHPGMTAWVGFASRQQKQKPRPAGGPDEALLSGRRCGFPDDPSKWEQNSSLLDHLNDDAGGGVPTTATRVSSR